MGSCCKNIFGSLICIALVGGGLALAFFYGPWFKKDDSSGGVESPTTLIAKSSSCPNCCNGLQSNCDLPITQVLWPFVHNAMSSDEDSFYAANNNLSLEKALVEGYRGLMIDSCICDGETIVDVIEGYVTGEENDKGSNNQQTYLGFCHASCAAGVRTPSTVFSNIKTFLNTNPNEVIIVEFEVGDGTLEMLHQAIDDSELDEYILRDLGNNGTVTEWPTFQQLIDANRRLILFAHGDGMASCKETTCPEGIFYTYDHFSQTNWNDNTCKLAGNDQTFYPERGFFLMNHWQNNDLDLPSVTNAEEFNSYESIDTRFSKCDEQLPNMLAVDFWSVGDVLKFVEDQNIKRGGGDAALTESRNGRVRHKLI